MHKLLYTALLLFTLSTAQGQHIRVATYNIRYDNPHDSLDLWETRYPFIAGLVELYDFDIFGTQEGLKHQLRDLKNLLDGYTYFGVGRDDGQDKGEFCAIFYKEAKYSLQKSGTFWLSTVTDQPNKGWDAALPRICTWGRFMENSSGYVFYFFNTHFDHLGKNARTESARLIADKIRTISAGNPFVFTGDLNFDEKDPNYSILRNSGILYDAIGFARVKYAPGGTFTAFDINAKPSGRIDHIFVPGNTRVERYGILTNTYNGRFPSDHFAVFAEIIIP